MRLQFFLARWPQDSQREYWKDWSQRKVDFRDHRVNCARSNKYICFNKRYRWQINSYIVSFINIQRRLWNRIHSNKQTALPGATDPIGWQPVSVLAQGGRSAPKWSSESKGMPWYQHLATFDWYCLASSNHRSLLSNSKSQWLWIVHRPRAHWGFEKNNRPVQESWWLCTKRNNRPI